MGKHRGALGRVAEGQPGPPGRGEQDVHPVADAIARIERQPGEAARALRDLHREVAVHQQVGRPQHGALQRDEVRCRGLDQARIDRVAARRRSPRQRAPPQPVLDRPPRQPAALQRVQDAQQRRLGERAGGVERAQRAALLGTEQAEHLDAALERTDRGATFRAHARRLLSSIRGLPRLMTGKECRGSPSPPPSPRSCATRWPRAA